MEDAPGVDCGHDQDDTTQETCSECGTALEWVLATTGVQKRVCPQCGPP